MSGQKSGTPSFSCYATYLVILTVPRAFFFFHSLFICLFMAILDLCCCVRFSVVATSVGYSLVEVYGLLLLRSTGSRAHRLQ